MKTKGQRWAAQPPAWSGKANSFLPNEAEREDRLQKEYYAAQGQPMLLDYSRSAELADGSRTVVDTEHWLAVVPYWAVCRSKRCCCRKRTQRITDSPTLQRSDLALALKS
ncbi:hypothetical protein [Klebsiella pneumoniae]|uniref:hypothetical protein n=1 Tax=Klebsiella pneumoniae TaxID=573 RepID=UPI00388FB633